MTLSIIGFLCQPPYNEGVISLENLKMIRHAELKDAQAMAELYNHYVQTTTAVLDNDLLTAEAMLERIEFMNSRRYPIFVAEHEGEVIAWASGQPWAERGACAKTVSCVVYVKETFGRQGIGTKLLQNVIAGAREHGFHALMVGVTDSNTAGIALCEKAGFKRATHFKDLWYKFNDWHGVCDYQLLLD